MTVISPVSWNLCHDFFSNYSIFFLLIYKVQEFSMGFPAMVWISVRLYLIEKLDLIRKQ